MKKITLLLGTFLILAFGFQLSAQKVVVIGANHTSPDGITFVATQAISNGEIIYFTEDEYNNTTNVFTSGESVTTFTASTAISVGEVIFLKEVSSNTLTVSCSSGVCGTAVVSTVNFALGSSGEQIYAYSDTDANPTNGVTEIYSVFYSFPGNIPAGEDPTPDFPSAVVVDGFASGSPDRTEFNASRDMVSQAELENPANYTNGSANADLDTSAFTNLNLAGANPVVTVTVSPAMIAEDAAGNMVYTFSRTMDATNPLTVNFNVGGTATFSSDYSQTGAATFTAMSGTVTFPGGMSTVAINVDPTTDTDLEANETVELTVTAGTGYDTGAPGTATGTINNDDTMNITPVVAVVGTTHTGTEGFSFVALDDIAAGTNVYFTENPFDMSTLSFTGSEAVVLWTAPGGGVLRGEVIVATETGTNTFTTTCNSGTCGSVSIVSGNFSLANNGEAFFAYGDSDTDHTNGITQVDAVLFTGTTTTPGGTIPAAEDPTTKYIGSVLVDGFPAVSPSLTEYDPTKRGTTVDQANFQNTANWLHAQAAGTLSTVPFSNIIIATGSANPAASVTVSPASVLEDGVPNLVFTFSLDENATSDITVNFTVDGTATFSTDYSVSGAATFDASSGTVVIGNGTSSAQVTVDPTADTDVETQETVELMIAAGTGYDGGSPNDATGTITNDDTSASMPLVAITGLNHTTADGFSFVAAEDIPAGSTVFFTEDEFDNTTLLFSSGEAVLQWTSPGFTIPKGDVIVVTEPSSNTFALSCSGTGGADCGSLSLITGSFSIATNGETFYAYKDDDTDPTNGVSDIYAVLYTGNSGTPGGNIPMVEDPSGIFLNALVVDGFPASAPDRTEYDPTKRNVPVSMADFENIANWLHGQSNMLLSTVPFTNLGITDDEPPVITCPANIVVNNDGGLCEATVTLTDPTATDNVSTNFVFVGIRDDGMLLTDPFPVGLTTITWTAEDEAGNVSTSCDQTVTVNDVENPTAVCADITVQLDAAGNGSIVAADVDGGSTDNCPGFGLSVDIDTFTIADLGANPVELTVTDASGNTASCTATVTVEDNIDPTAICVPDYTVTVELDAAGNGSIVATDIDNGSNDASGIASLSVNPSNFTCANIGENIVTLTVVDNNGNMSNCTSIVLVADLLAPDITCPADIMVMSSDGNPVVVMVPPATALDNCDPMPAITFERSDNAALDLNDPFPLGTTQIMWTATDASGNFASCIQDVTVNFTASMGNDIVTFTVPSQVGMSAIDAMAKTVMAQVPFGTDLTNLTPTIGISPDATINPMSGVAQDFTNPVMYTVTAQDMTPADWTVTIVIEDDNIPPTVICPANIVVGNDPGQCGAVVNFTVTASDERPGVGLVVSPDSGSFFPVGTTMVTATATDAAGNMATCTFDVTVNDNEPPAIVCPADITVDVPFGDTGANVNFAPSATDNCPGMTVSASPMSGSFFPLGTTAVNATATDASGNMANCSFNVTVNELPPTVLTVLSFVLVNADTDMDIMTLSEGDMIDVSTLPTMNLNIRAETTMDTESVFMDLTGAQNSSRTENVAPYALFGNSGSNYAPHVFALGNYNLTATPYSADGLGGTMGTPLSLNFEIVNPGIGAPLILVDSSTDTPLMNLTEGTVINKGVLGDLLFGVIYNAALNPNGVKFDLTGPISESRQEGIFPPYSLFGDIGVDIQGRNFPAGDYTLVADPSSGPTVMVNFQVIDVDPVCVGFDAFVDDTTDPSTCGGSDGEIQIGVSGFTPPLTYDWSHNMALNNGTASGLTAGPYTVAVTDDNGCTETLMVILEDPDLPVVTFTALADLTITDGVQAGLGGGTPTGGVYSGPGVTDDGNGMTYSFDPAAAGVGIHTLMYTFTDGNGCTNSASDDVEVTDPSSVLSITGFVLVNADSDSDIVTLIEGSIIDKSTLATMNLNIRANATSDVESVRLELSGAVMQGRTENVAPYALYGDLSGDYLPGAFPAGDYTLTATPYSGNNLSGTMGTAMTINFEVTEGGGGGFALKLYPNPAVTEIAVEMIDTEKEMEIFAIQVHDMQGRLIRSYNTKDLPGGEHFKMSTYSFQSGVYYMTVVGSKGTVQKKTFVVNK